MLRQLLLFVAPFVEGDPAKRGGCRDGKTKKECKRSESPDGSKAEEWARNTTERKMREKIAGFRRSPGSEAFQGWYRSIERVSA